MSKRFLLGVVLMWSCDDELEAGQQQVARDGDAMVAETKSDGRPDATDAKGVTSDASGWGDVIVPSCGANCVLPHCAGLDVASCKLDAECRVLKARPFDLNFKCRGDEEEVGCADAKTPCDGGPTRSFDPQGRSYIFLDSCLPQQFRGSESSGLYDLCNVPFTDPCAGLTYLDCDAHPECRDNLGCPVIAKPPIGPSECEQRSTENCKSDTKCASMAAQPLDATCGWEELVGCITLGRTCHGKKTYAKNTAGRVFSFYTEDCLPPGFTAVDAPPVGAGVCAVTYPQRCAALGVERCGDDPGCEPVVGEPLDLDAHCIEAPVAFACAAKSEAREPATVIAAAGDHRYRLNGYRYVPELWIYTTADGAYYSAATKALLSWPACR